jgi:DNA repair protein RecN (Recombination protein N)
MARARGSVVIESVSIQNLGVIASAELDFGQGFNVLTGETGAGKTMVLTALGLLLGARADSSAIRTGAAQLQVSGTFLVSNPAVATQLEELGVQLEENRLIVNRVVARDGRSKASLGGLPVPITTLSQIAEQLVTVHGQSEQIRLRSNSAQRDALDAFGNYPDLIAAYQASFRQYRDAEARLERLRSAGAQDRARIQELKSIISEVEAIQLQPGESEQIRERVERLSNVESLRQAAAVAHEALSSEGDFDALSALGSARRALEGSDPILSELAGRLREIAELTQDVSAELSSYLHDLDADPAQLEHLLQRRADIISLERKLGLSGDEMLERLPIWQAELLDLDSSEDQIERLEVQLQAQLSQLSFAAGELSAARASAAEEMALRVNAELAGLAMGGAKLDVKISRTEFELTGQDRIELQLAAFSGAEARPISKGASGGELSRIMLAIELVLSSSDLSCMVFDEVDAGVGGQAAVELGRRLAKLSESTQVLVVTHLPQVAAFADQHIRVLKGTEGSVTNSEVSVLALEQREVEIARMLAGNSDSAAALLHARELLQSS